MLITRQASDQLADQVGGGGAGGEEDEDGEPKPRYPGLDFGRGGVMLDLDPGDEAKVIESQTPSDQFQGFTQAMIMVALKALDIPFVFFDESHAAYSGARLA